MNKKVAIISYSYRLPGVSKKPLWDALISGDNLISQVPADRWSYDAFLHPDPKHPGTSYSFSSGTLGDISGFDAAFFGISPREAANMDPQQRLLLELTWEALENAGIPPETLRGSRSQVIIGVSTTDYSYRLTDDLGMVDSSTATGNAASILANRLSYFYDLKGASLIIDTACSSSLVAFHHACQAILSGQTDVAITGGICLHLHPYGFLTFSTASMLSPTGRCHVFDEAADGYVRSEGAGIFILKDYDQALADQDPIVAVVAGSAVNTDGHKSSMTVPCAKSQAALIEQACQSAALQPEDIDYFEAHGTGTQVGDPIETEAIGMALGQHRITPLPIGSIKSNLGHLEAAAGIAGLTKAILTLNKRCIPPTIGFNRPNPNIKFSDWKLEVVTAPKQLKKSGKLTVGINSFGFGGANAHIILQSEADSKPSGGAICRPAEPLPIFLSARSPEALKQAASELASQLAAQTELSLYDLAYSSRFHRQQLNYAALFEVNSISAAKSKLTAFATQDNQEQDNAKGIYTQQRLENPRGPIFVYSGNGCQWEGMGQELIENDPIFRRAVEAVDRYFVPLAGYSLVAELAGGNGPKRLERTEISQPALFALQVGITKRLRKEGIVPAAVAGHSVGEIAAAWASGALSLQGAVKVIYYRSLHQGLTKGQGQMTAVGLPEQGLVEMLSEARYASLSLAGSNSPRGCTIAGPESALDIFETELSKKDLPYKRLDLDYAFHSPVMDGIEVGIRRDLANLKTHTTIIPFISTISGQPTDGRQLTAEYWWHNIRKPVQFQLAVDRLMAKKYNLFVEIGAHPILQNYLKDILRENNLDGAVITSLSRSENSPDRITATARQIALAGYDNCLERWFPVKGNFVNLPNYPWQRERHWVSATPESLGLLQRNYSHALLGYPLVQQQGSWENHLDTKKFPWLADHQVGDSVVFPGAGFAELVCAAAALTTAAEVTEIEELEILAPLLLSAQSKIVRTSLQKSSGNIVLESRSQGEDAAWTPHIKARIIQGPTDKTLSNLKLKLPKRAPDFSQEDHAAITQRAGLNYGPAFRAISHGWAGTESAIAALRLPEDCEYNAEQFYLHPVLLDCAFQLSAHLLPTQQEATSGIAYIPTRIERFHLYNDKQLPTHATARILVKSPYSITAEFTLFDQQQNAVALYKGVRFKAIRLKKSIRHSLSFLDYHLTPAPRGMQYGTAEIESQIQASLLPAIKSWYQDQRNLKYVQEVEPLLESLTAAYISEALGKLANSSGAILSETLPVPNRDATTTRALLDSLLAIGLSQGDVQPADQGWQFSPPDQDDISADLIWNTLIREYPDYLQPILSVGRCGLHLLQRLDGQQPLSSLEPQQSLYSKQISAIHNKGFAPYLAQQLAAIISNCQQSLAEGERLSIIEVGHDGPLLAEALCGNIDFHICDYSFSGPTEEAIENALALQKQYPQLQVDQPGKPRLNSQQLALVHLNFLEAESLKTSLSELSQRLTADASILLIGEQKSNWLDFILNITAAEKSHQPLSIPQLTRLLNEQQFQLDETFTKLAEKVAGPYLLMAKQKQPLTAEQTANVVTDKANWLLICSSQAEEQQLAQTLASRLTEKQQTAEVLCIASVAELEAKLAEPAHLYDQFENIVQLYGFLDVDTATAAISRCEIAAGIIQFCESSDFSQSFWVLTNGVAETFPCDQRRQNDVGTLAEQPPADAALWGFARTAMNEAGRLQVRMTDLPREMTSASQNALLAEWLAPSQENELCLTAQGARYAPRLRREASPATPVEANQDNSITTLEFHSPGQLRNLHWLSKPAHPPAADEIEVEVLATGLNFRDVMYTLGLLSDEALEDGFAGASLGLEFSGRISRIGGEHSDFASGDLVVGFGPASFSNRLLTKADAVARLPENIDPVAAATIPTAFFTAYYALHHCARLQPGEKVLIHGAAGGVGIAAIQVAQWLGAEIYATAGSEEKRDFLQLLGVEKIYDSRSLTFAEEILAESADGEGVDVVLNSLNGEAIRRNFRVLKPLGRFLEIGKRDFYANTEIGLRPFRNNISYFGIDADQLRHRSPDLANRLFREMMELFQQGHLHPLPYTLFNALHVEDAFRYMQQAKQIGKILVGNYRELPDNRDPSLSGEPQQLKLKKEASYLITGGLSGLGLRLGRWLVERGARHLLLISRRGEVTPEERPALEALETMGVTVYPISCDVTDRTELEKLLTSCKSELPPIRGIIHAATTIEDGLIRNQTRQQLRSGMAAKLLGAQNLHELTAMLDLDLFILLSSATTLFGNPGQSSYVAANHWLEALAAHRRARQLPATCIRLGAIDDVGFLARNQDVKNNLQNRMGGGALHSDDVTDVIEQMLLSDCRSTLGCLEFDWVSLKRFLPSAQAAKFAEIDAVTDENDADHEHQIDLQQMLTELSTDELHAELVQLLKAELSRILLIAENKIDPHRSLYDIGLDSLMGVELTAAVEDNLGISIPVMLLSEAPSLNKLSSHIIKSLKGEGEDDDEDQAARQQVQNIAAQHGVGSNELADLEEITDQLTSSADGQQIIKP